MNCCYPAKKKYINISIVVSFYDQLFSSMLKDVTMNNINEIKPIIINSLYNFRNNPLYSRRLHSLSAIDNAFILVI